MSDATETPNADSPEDKLEIPEEAERGPSEEDLEKEIEAALAGTSLMGADEEEQSMEDALAAWDRAQETGSTEPKEGAFCQGIVAGVTDKDVFVEFGPRLQGVVPAGHFGTPPDVGSTIKVFVREQHASEGIFLCSLHRSIQTAEWDGLEVGSILQGTVRATNTGGFEIQCGVLTAFMPISHMTLERVDEPETFVDRAVSVEVIEIDREKRRLIVSRRGILRREREETRAQAVSSLAPGVVLSGTVTRVEPFGAFVDVGGVEGLLHVSELAWKRVEDPKEHVTAGDKVTVKVLSIEENGRRISLSKKALDQDPWLAFIERNPVGSVVEGAVTRMAHFGAFVEVAEGVEGLAHVSQLAPHSVRSPKEVVSIGQTLSVRVANIEPDRRRIGLSLLSERGDLLTADVADDATIRSVLTGNEAEEGETQLGALLRKALEGKDESS